jgi:hypothetical protein
LGQLSIEPIKARFATFKRLPQVTQVTEKGCEFVMTTSGKRKQES